MSQSRGVFRALAAALRPRDGRPVPARHIAIALALCFLALLVRAALDPWIGNAPSIATLWAAVAVAVWLGGWRPAVLTLVFGYAAVTWLAAIDVIFDEPWHDPASPTAAFVLLLAYLASGAAIIALGEGMRRAGSRAERLNHQLKARIDELAAVRAQLAVELSEMTRLHGLSSRLLEEDSFEDTLAQALRASLELLGTDRGHVQTYDDDADALRLVASLGFQEPFLRRMAVLHRREGVPGMALDLGERVVCEDVSADPQLADLAPYYADEGIRAVLATPLLGGDGRLVGMLTLHFARRHHPSPRDLRLLDLYASQAARVLEFHRTRRQLELHRADLEAAVEQRTSELREVYQQLRLAERMAGLGTLAAGLGHDIGNLLLPLRAHIKSLARAELSPRQRRDVEALGAVADYLHSLCNGLRSLAICPDRAGEATDLAAWWRDARMVMKHALPRRVFLRDQMPDSAGCVAISRPALSQIVFNLVQNAGDAIGDSAKGAVTVSLGRGDERFAELRISDNGPGMSEEVRRRCTEPFFSTKDKPTSSGLGLALVRHLLQQAGGGFDIETEAGRGTAFILRLPRAGDGQGEGSADTDASDLASAQPTPTPVVRHREAAQPAAEADGQKRAG